jgi:hypothetical protein
MEAERFKLRRATHVKHPNKISSIPLALALMLVGKLVLPAQDWQTVDDFALGEGNAEAHGVAVDATGGVYVVGTASGHAIVRYSADGGSNWITRDDFVYDSTSNNVFNAVMVDYQGTVFVGGSSGGYWDGHWIVRRSQDQGVTWETVDDFHRPFSGPDQPGTNGVVYSLCSDGQGRVFAAGPMILTGCPCYNSWWLRGSSIGGTNWDTKLVLFSGYAEGAQTTCADENVYVTGSVGDGEGPFVGLMVRSSDHGVTWTTNFQRIADLLLAINSDSAGNLYSAGYSWSSNSVEWLVREATPGGTNWIILDRLRDAESFGNGQAFPSSIAVDALGNVSVTGQLREPLVIYGTNGVMYSANVTWITRQFSVATGQWSTTDLFSYSTNINGSANGVAFAPSGSLFAVGYATSDLGQRRWIVRKQAAPGSIAQARALKNEVNDMIARAAISRERANVLLAILDRIVTGIEQGKSPSVCTWLRTFSNLVQQFVNQGTLAQSDGQSIMNAADNLRLLLRCPETQPGKSQP